MAAMTSRENALHKVIQYNTQYNVNLEWGHREWLPSLSRQGLLLKMLD